MSPASGTFLAPLPRAPTATAPAALYNDSALAVHNPWALSVFGWVLVWRSLLFIELCIALVAGFSSLAYSSLLLIGLWTLLSIVPTIVPPRAPVLHRWILVFDLAVCIYLLSLAVDSTSLSIIAAFTCSTAISWAAYRPVDAFIAGGSCSLAFLVMIYLSDNNPPPGAASATLSLFIFFSLATAGFFTVAHRIGALEIAGEVERERGRYRRDLHDRLGQALSGMHFEVQAVDAGGLDQHTHDRLSSLAEGYGDAQRMLHDLVSIGDEPLVGTNIASVIREEARRMAQQSGAFIGVETTGDSSRVPPWMRPHIVAVAGECVNNALKNGAAKHIEVTLDVTDDTCVLSVTDDGSGFDNPAGTVTEKAGHYGLREMVERARICSGEVVIASQLGFGTRVRLQVPIPLNAGEDVLERDASKLRENVWSLLLALRVLLGALAISQLGFLLIQGTVSRYAYVLCAVIFIDISLGILFSKQIRSSLQHTLLVGVVYCFTIGVIYLATQFVNLPPVVLFYAPLVLIAVGVARDRSSAARLSWMLFGIVLISALAVHFLELFSNEQRQSALIHVTDIALLGMAAVQGAKLLDRLEALQVRVRFQALARLRQGLSGRMRDQLTERLRKIEQTVRMLANNPSPTDEQFKEELGGLIVQSTELKQRLREIVHTLADTTPTGRTPAHD